MQLQLKVQKHISFLEVRLVRWFSSVYAQLHLVYLLIVQFLDHCSQKAQFYSFPHICVMHCFTRLQKHIASFFLSIESHQIFAVISHYTLFFFFCVCTIAHALPADKNKKKKNKS